MTFLFPRPLEDKDHPIPPFDEALFDAAKNGDEKTLAARLKAGVPPDHMAGDLDGMTPLMYAVLGGHHGCMRLLLEAGADVHLIDRLKGRMPLRAAIEKQDAEAVKILLEFNADPGWKCVRVGGDNSTIGLPVTDEDIAKEGDPGIAAMVTEARKKFRVNQLAHDNPADLSEMRRLLAEGAPVDIQNNNGQTALMYAVIHRNVAAVKLLLEFGADTEVTWGNNGITALRLACGAHMAPTNIEVVKLLLAHGADPFKLDDRGRTMMHAAATSGDPEIMKLIVLNGVSATAKDAEGNAPAHAAQEWNSEGAQAAAMLEKVNTWNLDEIGRKATSLDKPVKPMKPISFGKK